MTDTSSDTYSSSNGKKYKTERACVDGNWAIAHAAYRCNDCAFIFPITPSSPMGEYSDEFATKHKKNIFDQEMKIVEMQSEGGAGKARFGALIPSLFCIAGAAAKAILRFGARDSSSE